MNKLLQSKKANNEIQQVLNELFGKTLHIRAWMQDNVDLNFSAYQNTEKRNY